MKIRNQLTILFTLLTATILLVFSLLIYISIANDKTREFYDTLKKEATTKFTLLQETTVDAHTLQTIYLNNREILNEVQVAIYFPDFDLLYHDANEIDFVKETSEMIDEIILKGEIRFVQDKWNVIGFRFEHNGDIFAITAAAFDQEGNIKLARLRQTLTLLWISSLVILFLIGRYMSRKSLKPVSDIIENVEQITATNLHLRIETGDNIDEIAELAITFNAMLDRIEDSFDAQKLFVSNIAHELRTPLAAVIAELELALNRNRNNEYYILAVRNVLNDAKKLSRLCSSLLDLARASYDKTEIHFEEVRIDEIIIDARNEVLRLQPEYNVSVIIDTGEDNDEFLTIYGNAYMLKVAFMNIIENGCKFSLPPETNVHIEPKPEGVTITVSDRGSGIPEHERDLVFMPFYRGENSWISSGHGIGLALTKKIIDLHHGTIKVQYNVDKGSEIVVSIDK
jgi:two-component system sensor histidine kinase ArlS